MVSGKKIASMLALVTSLGILGAACTAKVDEAPNGADPEEQCDLDEGTAAEAITRDPNKDLNRGSGHEDIRDHQRRRQRERCERRCNDELRGCMRREHGHIDERAHRSRCMQRHQICREDCRRLWD